MNISRQRRWHIFIGILIFICLVSLFFRTYKWSELTVFNGDDGMDLSIVWNMEYQHHRPLVGPFLSIPNIYTPPTYYYLTWMFYHISPTPNAVRIGYLCMDIFTMIILVMFITKLGGRTAGVIGSILYATSTVLTFHGRAYWQPFPMQWFLAPTLLFFWYAHTRKSILYLWLSNICYVIALSIYPSPLLLLPFVLYHTKQWYIRTKKYTAVKAMGLAFCMVFLSSVPIFMPQLIYEYTHKFPTIHTILSTTTLARTQPLNVLYWHMVTSISTSIQSSAILPQWFWSIIPLAFLALLVAVNQLNNAQSSPNRHSIVSIDTFFPPYILLLGFIGVIIMQDYVPHRVWSMLPIFISVISLVTARAFHKGLLSGIGATLLIVVYLYGNISSLYTQMKQWNFHGITHTKKLAQIVLEDMKHHAFAQSDVTLHYKIPDNSSPNYQLYRILYWLIDARTFTIPLSQDGNTLAIDTEASRATQKTAYLFCENIHAQNNDICISEFVDQNAEYTVRNAYQYDYISLYVLSRK